MSLTDRMLIGAIANNPAAFESAGEYRCCRTCELIFYTSAKQPDTAHDAHDWFALPSLNPDGSKILERAFQRFITRWSPERQEQLETFARRNRTAFIAGALITGIALARFFKSTASRKPALAPIYDDDFAGAGA